MGHRGEFITVTFLNRYNFHLCSRYLHSYPQVRMVLLPHQRIFFFSQQMDTGTEIYNQSKCRE